MTRALLNVTCVSALYRNVLLSKYYFPEGIIPDDASGRDLCRRCHQTYLTTDHMYL